MNAEFPSSQIWGEGCYKCQCNKKSHTPEFIVLTGGPGAGKTAVLEMAIKIFCKHVTIVPESASVIFSGGFFRRNTLPARKGAQRAIFKVQSELETIIKEEKQSALALCDRGTLDGLAYWPETEESFWQELNSTKLEQLNKYKAVIHLETPDLNNGYTKDTNPMRVENVKEAKKIDKKLLEIWKDHPHRHIVSSHDDFFSKANKALHIIKSYIPECCRPIL